MASTVSPPSSEPALDAVAALRAARDMARNRFVVAMVLLFVLGGGTRIAGTRWGGVAPVALAIVLLLVAVVGTGAEWGWRGWRLHRAHDPWAYDPDLDGPESPEGPPKS